MKILQVHNFYAQYGGECNVVKSERIMLENAGHKVVDFYRHSSEILRSESKKKALAMICAVYNPLIKKELRTLCDREKPDVAHVHNVFPFISPSLYSFLGSLGIPVVQTVHNYRFVCPNGLLFFRNQTCEECLEVGNYLPAIIKCCFRESRLLSALYAAGVTILRREVQHITRFIAISEFVGKKLVAGGISPDKIRVCGNFIDKSVDAEKAVKDEYILFLGRLSEEKGLLILLDAVAKTPMIPIVIAGTGPLLPLVTERLAMVGYSHVRYVGFVSGADKTRLIQSAIVTVSPALWYENFPMAVVESLSLGTPVVASSIGGLPELVKNGVNGLLVSPGDVAALADAFIRIHNDKELACVLGKNAIKLARKQFSAEQHLELLEKIYNEAVMEIKSN